MNHLIGNYTKRAICSADYETVAKVPEAGIQLQTNRQAKLEIHRDLKSKYLGGTSGATYDVCQDCRMEYWRRLS